MASSPASGRSAASGRPARASGFCSGPSASGTSTGLPTRAISVAMVVSAENGTVPVTRLDEHEAERVHVGPAVDRLALGLLGRGVAGGAEHRALRLGPRRLGERAGQPEVGDAQAGVLAEEQVGGLDVAVDEAAAVGVVEGPGGLEADEQRLGLA